MPLRDLEQEGDENFNTFDTRKQVKTKTILSELFSKSNEAKEKARQQEEWLNPNNDELWTNH